MDVTNRFVLDFCRTFAREHPSAPILDFGCGGGELVSDSIRREPNPQHECRKQSRICLRAYANWRLRSRLAISQPVWRVRSRTGDNG